jgi:hypothetical protein
MPARSLRASGTDSFEDTLAAASDALQLQRKVGRRQLLSSIQKKSDTRSSLVSSVLQMVSAVTSVEEPASVDEREVVEWAKNAITNFATSRAEQAKGSRLPAETAGEVYILIDRLTGLLE